MEKPHKDLILIVDDVEQNVAIASQILRTGGYGIMAAFSGETALRMLEKRVPDLILLDIMMPGMDGFEVCMKLKQNEKLKNIPVIFLSALSDTDVKVKAFDSGGVDYISKPFHEAEVLARVAVHLKIAHLEKIRIDHIQQLTELNNEKDRLMQIVSHDLRSPVGGIKGLAQILLEGEEAEMPGMVREFAGIIVQTTDTLLNLVNDLLDIAKLESGKYNLNLTEFDIVKTINNTVRLQEKVAEKKGLSLVVDSFDTTLKVTADEPKIMQMLNNLISNAIKFTPKEGTVKLSLLLKNNTTFVVKVSDTGVGIPTNHLPNIFEKFGKHQRNGTSGEKGTGLGMPIVKRFVELFGGTIDVSSTVGVGTTFIIEMPLIIKAKQSS